MTRELKCIVDWDKLKKQSDERIAKTKREDGKVHIEGLGRVKDFISYIAEQGKVSELQKVSSK